jgi:hypothetical protein
MDELFLEKLNKKLDAIAKQGGIHFCPVCSSEHYEEQYRVFTSGYAIFGSPLTFVPLGTRKCKECGYEGKTSD